ncbi:MAG: hypothetical protein AAF441_16820 [Pseudomonadota bacterium]
MLPDATGAGEAAAAEAQGPVREEIMLYAGADAEQYASVWEAWKTTGGKLQQSWSTPAFLMSFAWLAYRKMRMEALIGFVAVAALTMVKPLIGLAALVAGMVAIGLFGKSLYAKTADKQVRSIMSNATNPESYIENLRASGGVSAPSAFLVGILMVVLLGYRFAPMMPKLPFI